MMRRLPLCPGATTSPLRASAAFAPAASAFTHVVKPGETLAQIAERLYGDAKLEVVLVGANALDTQGGTIIVPGMRLEVPAPGHHTVLQGETWGDLSVAWLGTKDEARTEALARVNEGVPWSRPRSRGKRSRSPPSSRTSPSDGETINAIAPARFWGDPNRGWELDRYTRRGMSVAVKRGEVVLVPMTHLKLTETGKAEARIGRRAGGREQRMLLALEQQRRGDAELPQLLADVRYGRYAEAVARGNRLLGGGALTHPQLAVIDRALVEAYVAIDAQPAAAAACVAWRSNDPNAVIDPVRVSPKIRAACAAH